MLNALNQFSSPQIDTLNHEVQRRHRENGLAYGAARRLKAGHRPWQLDLVPQMMAGADWRTLESGLQQRARLNAVLLKDLYGEQRVLRNGVIPSRAVFAHNGFVEGAVGAPFFDLLPFYSADVSRSPSGDWYVANDICQAPEGLGHALENRLIISGVHANLYRQTRVRRLAEYFKYMRSLLFRDVGEISKVGKIGSMDGDARCVILGYGTSHHNHFEQAYLSRYLGYTLVQANDLTVRGKHVYLKTVDGLRQVDVIFRFVDDADIDPLAGASNNINGVAGLLHAARARAVTIVNPIGVAALENPALNEWLPELCEFLLNEKLELLGTPTYWLGSGKYDLLVQARFNSLLFRNIDTGSELLDPQIMSMSEVDCLKKAINEEPERYVALERIGRSSAPSLISDRIELRQLTMRMFLMKSAGNYQAMPGGLGLLDDQVGGRRPKIHDMLSSKDVWVVSDSAVPFDTLLDQKRTNTSASNDASELPSSVAESLFWLGRYVERVENSARVLKGVCLHLRSDEPFENDDSAVTSLTSLLKLTTAVTGTAPGFIGEGALEKILYPGDELLSLISHTGRVGSLPHTLEKLSYSAAMVRDRLSGDMFRVVNALEDHQSDFASLLESSTSIDGRTLNSTVDKINDLLLSTAAFSGLSRENMTHGNGWRFHQIGKRIERALQTNAMLSTVFSDYHSNRYALEDLLNVLCSGMTYRRRHGTLLEPSLVFNLLVVDEANPRSLGFQLKNIEQLIQSLPGRSNANFHEPAIRATTEGLARIRLIQSDSLFDENNSIQAVYAFFNAMYEIPVNITSAISAQYFTHTDVPDVLYSGFDNSSDNVAPAVDTGIST